MMDQNTLDSAQISQLWGYKKYAISKALLWKKMGYLEA